LTLAGDEPSHTVGVRGDDLARSRFGGLVDNGEVAGIDLGLDAVADDGDGDERVRILAGLREEGDRLGVSARTSGESGSLDDRRRQRSRPFFLLQSGCQTYHQLGRGWLGRRQQRLDTVAGSCRKRVFRDSKNQDQLNQQIVLRSLAVTQLDPR